jgi:hypothetical protein
MLSYKLLKTGGADDEISPVLAFVKIGSKVLQLRNAQHENSCRLINYLGNRNI